MNPILSTRSLSDLQMKMLKKEGISVETYDAITVNLLNAQLPTNFRHYIFTSKNGVKGFLRNNKNDTSVQSEVACYCVGEKTSSLLREKGLKVIKMAENASKLGNFIVKQPEKGPFLIFTGNRNRPELREVFMRHHIKFEEIRVYETHLNPQIFSCHFECILFYSPSGIQSFLIENSAGNAKAICIGETTAREARKHFSTVWVANNPTTDSVLNKLIEIYPTIAIS
ncbi:uroporphyrinogen-III synthase [Muriicola soli]|uniref:Uroporphyrinogen-III synthase n=1 Tax=Muriicola soli TaxID=2507538 RepID=A0A411ECM2_9FLAO|nr:uroporphyrinogen-III synthase [Muriicola soli]QBA65482.1 uroporphyrinogen-III synthase [Muriicola soli]